MVQIHMVDGVEMVTAEDYRKVVNEFLGEAHKTTDLLAQLINKYESKPDRVKDDIPQADDRDAKINYPRSLPFEVLVFRNDSGDLVIDHCPKWLIKSEVDNRVGKSSDGSCFLVRTPYGMKKARAGDKIKFDPERGGLDVLFDWKGAPSVRD